MNTTDVTELLASLRDIHEPAAPSPTWPWWLLAAILATGFITLLWLRRKPAPATLATQQIEAARDEPIDTALVRLARLLRRHTATHGRGELGEQGSGSDWLITLDETFNTQFFSSGAGQIFGDDLYRSEKSHIDLHSLCDQLQALFDANPARAKA